MKRKKLFNIFFIIILGLIVINISIYFTSSNLSKPNSLPNNVLQNNPENRNQAEELNADNILINLNGYGLELPINGATGYTSSKLSIFARDKTTILFTLNPGTPFRIISEEGDFFQILVNDTYGYVESKYILINLPDVIPSIIYDNTNSYSALYKSNGFNLPNITNKQLYNTKVYNERLHKDSYLMPVLYPMAKKIAKIQNLALQNGESLKIYEAFRPYETQMKISKSLTELVNSNAAVKAVVNIAPWNKDWFIASTLSNHQRGIAIDTSLVKVIKATISYSGNYSYVNIEKYNEYEMPTKMHELSSLAATFTNPVSSKSKIAWKKAKFSESMNENAIKLQNYATSNGLYPLASEWWHFNDLDSWDSVKDHASNGHYFINSCFSVVPNPI